MTAEYQPLGTGAGGSTAGAGATLSRCGAFEAFVAVAMEAEGLVVSEAIKFPVTLPTRRAQHVEVQTHGYEVDLVGARRTGSSWQASISYLGSRGVAGRARDRRKTTNETARRRWLATEPTGGSRQGPQSRGAKRYGYSTRQVEKGYGSTSASSPAKGSTRPRFENGPDDCAWARDRSASTGYTMLSGGPTSGCAPRLSR